MTVGLIGAPSSVAGHWPGMEKAPAFLRAAGLPELLREAGARLVDHGDLPQLRWRADPERRDAQNLHLVADYLGEVAQRVDDAVRNGERPILVGGECTITIGAVAGFLRHYDDLGLMYVDGHLDLNTPASTASGVLDSMVMAHMFGHEGTTPELAEIGPRSPLLDPSYVTYFGYNERDMNPIEAAGLPHLAASAYPLSRVERGARAAAREALEALEAKVSRFALHLDVDVMSFTDFPIANVPTHHEGLTFEQLMECVEVFTTSDACVGVIVTEINPDHATEAVGERFARGLAHALEKAPMLAR